MHRDETLVDLISPKEDRESDVSEDRCSSERIVYDSAYVRNHSGVILEYVSNALEVQNWTIECGCRCGKTLQLSQSVGTSESIR
jgi:hypothetical protein